MFTPAGRRFRIFNSRLAIHTDLGPRKHRRSESGVRRRHRAGTQRTPRAKEETTDYTDCTDFAGPGSRFSRQGHGAPCPYGLRPKTRHSSPGCPNLLGANGSGIFDLRFAILGCSRQRTAITHGSGGALFIKATGSFPRGVRRWAGRAHRQRSHRRARRG